jgi:putative addiction module component (TIGR02574 family)
VWQWEETQEMLRARLVNSQKIAASLLKEYSSSMATIFEVEKLALALSERERATLIANLLDSLPPILSDDDEGIAEALRRDAELDANPDLAISLADLDADIRNRL